MTDLYLDADNAILGRLASHAAKQALLGHKVIILNCEKAVISGDPAVTRARYHHLMQETGDIRKGPFLFRAPDRFVRRTVRGMLPKKHWTEESRGRKAYKDVMCYRGIPGAFKGHKPVKVPAADASQCAALRRTTVGELCRSLGWRGKA
jgi:large subunit ribosomal protein L13